MFRFIAVAGLDTGFVDAGGALVTSGAGLLTYFLLFLLFIFKFNIRSI